VDAEFFYRTIFTGLVAITLSSAFVVVTARNLVRSAFALLFTLGGVAGLYIYLAADFLAATQIIVYVGGILVLILFGVMLTSKIVSVELYHGSARVGRSILLFAGLLFVLLSVAFNTEWPIRGTPAMPPTTEAIGLAFMTDYLLPFEAVSILLLAALIGAVYIARREVRK
jgi:NADH:ubiquinone oxidoreductase subunit 6 (subunit J)